MVVIPTHVEAGDVVLEVHGPDDAAAVADAINDSLDHLRPWMEWAQRPTNVQEQAMRLAMNVERAQAGGDVVYSIVDGGGRVVGGCGLHHRGEPESIEIGYWLRAGETGKGYVTAAAAGLTRVAFDEFRREIVRITCSKDNERSAAVPARLGFTMVGLRDDATMVWELRIDDFAESHAATIPVTYR